MKELFLQISNRQDLTQEQVQEVFDQILQNQLSESQIAAFLMGLKTKGETADEITGIVRALKAHATVFPETFSDAMCNCGTGVAIPNVFARKWIAPNRKKKLARLIEERKARGKFIDLHEFSV